MCGIAGIIRLDGTSPDPERLWAMADQLAHRGPDDAGIWIDGAVGFSHRRLSIIDIEGSSQPMTSADGRHTVVFNGEILNFRDLRRSVSYPWTTYGDTEVLLALHHHYGDDAVGQLIGQFAYALHDRRSGDVVLFRDRMGILPLYISVGPLEILFASEVKSILAVSSFARHVDENQLDAYLAGRGVPAPNTLFAGITKLLPGHSVRIAKSGIQTAVPYWKPPGPSEELKVGHAQATSLVRDALSEAVQRSLVADVPVGAYLSGGLDSSLIVALTKRHHGPSDLHTFSAGFGDRRFDELRYAEMVSNAVGTVHHPVLVTAEDFMGSWRTLTWHRDAPLSEPADVAVALLAKAASEHVKVVLSGEGSDELFAGYPKYRAARAVQLLGRLPAGMRVPLLNSISTRLPASGRRLRTVLNAAATTNEPERMSSWFAPFPSAVRQRLTGRPSCPPDRYAGRPLEGDLVRRMSLFDTGAWLADNLLERGDRMTMSASVELRPPFLDAAVVDLALRLPSNVKLYRNTSKWVVKEVARSLLPKEIIERPKSGFKVPLDDWFRHGLKDMAHDRLLSSDSFVCEVFDRSEIVALLESHLAGSRDEAIGIWTLLSLEVWHDEFFKQPRSRSRSRSAP